MNEKHTASQSGSGSGKEKWGSFLKSAKKIWSIVYLFRGIILSVPVAIAAIRIAFYNRAHLPEAVRFGTAALDSSKNLLLKTLEINRNVAVVVPMLLTFACLSMVLMSKRVIYPWLISVFSLLLPIALLLVNTFP